MISVRERNSRHDEKEPSVRHRAADHVVAHNSCRGCTACHQKTGIRASQEGISFGGSDSGDGGLNIQKPCAATFFQRNLGNSAMLAMAGRGGNAPAVQRKCFCGGSCGQEEELPTQAKLTVGPVDDVYEQEADRVAEQVMRMPDGEALHHHAGITVQRLAGSTHISLGRGESENDRPLMAHELTHVAQQGAGRRSDIREIQRTVVVNPDAAAADDILNQCQFLCPNVTIWRTGQTLETDTSSIASKSCECVTDAISDTSRTYTIHVDTVTSSPTTVTLHNGTTANIPDPSSGPRTYNGTNPTIHMPATAGSTVEFGGFSPAGSALWAPNWRILGHELCGHGRLNQSYAGSKGNRPGHDSTIDTENTIAAEHGGAARGHFSDTRQGESFHNPAGNRSRIVFMLVNGWHYEAP